MSNDNYQFGIIKYTILINMFQLICTNIEQVLFDNDNNTGKSILNCF